MQITVQVMLGQNEYANDLQRNVKELAEEILSIFGADPTKDVVTVSLNDSGSAGAMPMPPVSIPSPVTINSTFATQNSSPPGDKQTRTNTAALSDVSAIYIDNNSNEGNDISAQLLLLATGDRVEIRGVTDTSRYGIFTLNASPINQGAFVELPVSFVEAGSALTNSACKITVPAR